VLSGIAGASALAVPVFLSTEALATADRLDWADDPIFGLIEAYRAAAADWRAKWEVVESFEALAPDNVSLSDMPATVLVRHKGRPSRTCTSEPEIEEAFGLIGIALTARPKTAEAWSRCYSGSRFDRKMA
jgi:hypothetical protein